MHDIRAALAGLPGAPTGPVRPLGAGLDNTAYLVGDLVVRSRRTDPAGVAREAALLELVAGVSPVPVPRPVLADPVRGVLAYRLLPGVPLLGRPVPPGTGAALGGLLDALRAVPPQRVAGLVPVDGEPPAAGLDEARRTWPRVAAAVPAPVRARVAAFLAAPAPAPPRTRVFGHHDLGAEHVLVDPVTGAVTGVIDWTDAAVGDPAYDLGLILRDLGPAHYAAAAGARAADLAGRARVHAVCAAVEDLAYGRDGGAPGYAAAALAALGRLCPAP